MFKKETFLFVIRKINYFGATANSLDFIVNLNYNNFKKKIIIEDLEIHDYHKNYYFSKIKKLSIKYYFLNKIFPVSSKFQLKLYYYLRKFIIIKYYSKLFFILILKIYKPKFLYFNYIPNLETLKLNEIYNKKIILHIHFQLNKLKILTDDQKKILTNSYKILTYSNEASKILSKYVEKDKLITFELSLNFDKIQHLIKSKDSEIRDILEKIDPFKKDKFLIIANFADFSLRKGADIFCEVAHKISQTELKIIFFWIGETKNKKEVLDNNYDCKNIIFCNRISNIYPILNEIYVLMINSRDEGGPTILLEGMYLKKISLTHKFCGFSERVLNQNKNGICLKENSPDLYAEKIIQIYKNSSSFENIKDNAFNKINRDFNILNNIEQINQALKLNNF